MKGARLSNRHGGVLALTMTGIGIATIGGVAVLGFNARPVVTAAPAAKAPRTLEPGEVGTVLRLVGITPESAAAAGMTVSDCDSLFSTGTAYCLQAERLTQLRIAYGNVSLASSNAVHPERPPALDSQGQELSVSQAHTELENLRNEGFAFVTTGVDSGIVTKLSRSRDNAKWKLPAPYLVVNRTDAEWVTLRAALVCKRHAADIGQDLDQAHADVVSAADGNSTVAQALSDYASRLAGIREAWHGHETATP